VFRSNVKRCDGHTLDRMPLGPTNDPVWSYVCDSADVVRLRHAGRSWEEIAAELGTGDPDLMRRLYELRQHGTS